MGEVVGFFGDNLSLMVLIAVTATAAYAIPKMKSSYLNRGVLRWWKHDGAGEDVRH